MSKTQKIYSIVEAECFAYEITINNKAVSVVYTWDHINRTQIPENFYGGCKGIVISGANLLKGVPNKRGSDNYDGIIISGVDLLKDAPDNRLELTDDNCRNLFDANIGDYVGDYWDYVQRVPEPLSYDKWEKSIAVPLEISECKNLFGGLL